MLLGRLVPEHHDDVQAARLQGVEQGLIHLGVAGQEEALLHQQRDSRVVVFEMSPGARPRDIGRNFGEELLGLRVVETVVGNRHRRLNLTVSAQVLDAHVFQQPLGVLESVESPILADGGIADEQTRLFDVGLRAALIERQYLQRGLRALRFFQSLLQDDGAGRLEVQQKDRVGAEQLFERDVAGGFGRHKRRGHADINGGPREDRFPIVPTADDQQFLRRRSVSGRKQDKRRQAQQAGERGHVVHKKNEV